VDETKNMYTFIIKEKTVKIKKYNLNEISPNNFNILNFVLVTAIYRDNVNETYVIFEAVLNILQINLTEINLKY